MSDDTKAPSTGGYDKAVLTLLRNYGVAMEWFGAAKAGSSRGMEATMRFAEAMACDTLYAMLGREPTRDELAQIPPLYEAPVESVPLSALVGGDEVREGNPRE